MHKMVGFAKAKPGQVEAVAKCYDETLSPTCSLSPA
jgi:hypothetical protein